VVLVVVVDKKMNHLKPHLVEQVTVQIQHLHHKVLPEELVREVPHLLIWEVEVVVQLLLVLMQHHYLPEQVVQDHQLALLVVI
tara:strand:- start:239 stop:487 length:249 start_codon:yes stop_codon:yes gene_type:complete